MSSESILLNPASRREQAQIARQKFRSGYGDHITLLNVYRAFEGIGKDNVRSWCHEHFINMRNILYVREVRTQLQVSFVVIFFKSLFYCFVVCFRKFARNVIYPVPHAAVKSTSSENVYLPGYA